MINTLKLADALDTTIDFQMRAREAAMELRRLQHNHNILMKALMKACGGDQGLVSATIESQGGLK